MESDIDTGSSNPAAQVMLEDSMLNSTPHRRGTIMLIDDSWLVRTIIEASFTRAGLPVTSYEDGFAAMRALVRGDVGIPDILLLDIGLPRMDGYEVARILRMNPRFQRTLIVMLTAKDGVLDRLRSRVVGAHDFITKPFRVPFVVDKMKQYLATMYPPTSTDDQ